MPRPRLIIISGPPGAGKTHLARPLARRLGYPLLQKDFTKERLADAFGAAAPDHSRALGLGSILVLYDIVREILQSAQDVVIESTFYRGTSEADLLPLVALSDATLVHVTADDEVLLSRYKQRMLSAERHPVHNGEGRLEELRRQLATGATRPPDLGIPTLVVDTTYGQLDIEEIAFIVTEGRDTL